ncbi:hypothetical protein MMC25_001649 [Agyrium rufum]|nr:hypothetical protein [Agyrium rufum]
MSPRRSIRARTSQPTSSAIQHTTSSTSSISSSGRAERATRSNHKALPSPQRSNPRSQSLDDPDESIKPPPRRTRSGHEDLPPTTAPATAAIIDEDDEEGDDSVTRCICGQAEYPGLPVMPTAVQGSKSGLKGAGETPGIPHALPTEIGAMFIQCDTCSVWQHGGCVGILDEEMSPEEYFCEQCRKDLHKLANTATGQKYSRYLPVHEDEFLDESPEPDRNARRSRNSKQSKATSEFLAGKRRSTMNSREAAYDEVQEFQRAIEESKKESVAKPDGSVRRNKRSRSESQDGIENVKRQRTNSHSSSSTKRRRASSSDNEADPGKGSESNGKPALRGAAARNHAAKELQDREKAKEQERADAAGRRKGRAERRRNDDDSPPSDEPLSRTTSRKAHDSTAPPYNSNATPSSPPPPASPSMKTTPSHKKSGRPPAKRGGRVGRNQYTKLREEQQPGHGHSRNGSMLSEDIGGASGMLGVTSGGVISEYNTRRRSRSRSVMRGEDNDDDGDGREVNGVDGSGGGGGGASLAARDNGNGWGEAGRPSRPKHMNPNRTSMNEMKRRVAGIMEFVVRTRREVGGVEDERKKSPSPTKTGVRKEAGASPSKSSGTIDGGEKAGLTNGAIEPPTPTPSSSVVPARDLSPSKDHHALQVQNGVSGVPGGGNDDVDSPYAGSIPNKPISQLVPSTTIKTHEHHDTIVTLDDFRGLSSAQMMKVLVGKLDSWQKDYGRWGEK